MLSNKVIQAYNNTRQNSATNKLCHAPFVNMNFEQNGDITACCFNRTHVLGKYPDMDLMDIWFSEKADELRRYIDNNDLGGGCEICAKQLVAGNFMNSRARGFDQQAVDTWDAVPEKLSNKLKHGKWLNMPRTMEFELSNTCNLECVMCHGYFSSTIRKNREHREPMHQAYDDAFVEQLRPFIPYLKEMKFLGGEPFLIDIYYKIWELVAELNPSVNIYITTNATVYNKRVAELLGKLKVNPVISLDSIVSDTYTTIRKNANYDRVMENVASLLEYTHTQGTEMSFAVCPMTLNMNEMPDMVRYCNSKGIRLFFNTVFQPEIYSLRYLPENELRALIESYQAAHLPEGTELEQHNKAVLTDLIHQLEAWLNERANNAYKFTEAALNRWQELKAELAIEPWQVQMGDTIMEHLHANSINTELEDKLTAITEQQGAESFARAYFLSLEWIYASLGGPTPEELRSKMAELNKILVPQLNYDFIASELIRMRPDQLLETIMEFSTERLLHEVQVRFNS